MEWKKKSVIKNFSKLFYITLVTIFVLDQTLMEFLFNTQYIFYTIHIHDVFNFVFLATVLLNNFVFDFIARGYPQLTKHHKKHFSVYTYIGLKFISFAWNTQHYSEN